jgi:hypothetical protein
VPADAIGQARVYRVGTALLESMIALHWLACRKRINNFVNVAWNWSNVSRA